VAVGDELGARLDAYHLRVETWRGTEASAAGDGAYGGRTWAMVETNIPMRLVMRGGPNAPQGGLVYAEGQDLITMDQAHFPLSANLRLDDEVKVLNGENAGNWLKVVEAPEIRQWRAMKQEVMVVRLETATKDA
jgi:hypothetical protein